MLNHEILTLDVGLEEVPGQELERHVPMMWQMEQVKGVDYLANKLSCN